MKQPLENDFVIKTTMNKFVPEEYLEPSGTSMLELFSESN